MNLHGFGASLLRTNYYSIIPTKNAFPVRFSFLDQTISSDLIWPTRSHPKRVIALDYGHGTCLSRLRTARGKKVSYAQLRGDYE